MPLTLVRVDERLIHGQVVVGWGTRLGLELYVVVDDALAGSEWEQELYRSGLPDNVTARFLTVDEAVGAFPELLTGERRTAIIARGTSTLRALVESGVLAGQRINIGGIHAGDDRERVLDYVYLGPAERHDLAVIAAGVDRVSARDLPTAPEVPLDDLLAG